MTTRIIACVCCWPRSHPWRATAAPYDIPAPVESTAKAQITAATLEAPIRFLASDALEGRGPATRGDTLARLYLAAELQSLGYLPGGEKGGWEQTVDVVGVTAQLPAVWSFTGQEWRRRSEAGRGLHRRLGVQNPTAAFDGAGLVFVGYGIEAPEYKWDDFKGVDLKGKVLVMLNNDPDWDPKLFAGKTRLYYGRWTYKYEVAARHGAAGVIIVHTTPSAGYPWQVVQSSWGGEQFELPAEGEPRVQLKAWATEAASRRLVQAAGADLDKLIAAAKSRSFKPVPLGTDDLDPGSTNKVSRVRTANVAGLLPGSDPKLKEEVVIYTAHHDHFGIGDPDSTGDNIYNGAEDNAAGCCAGAGDRARLAALPERPRRSVLMLFVAGEEQGLLGSKYYSLHPTFAPGKIAANINYDGGNYRGRTRDLTQLGAGKSSLDAIAKTLVEKQGRVLVPDQFPDGLFLPLGPVQSSRRSACPRCISTKAPTSSASPRAGAASSSEEWDRARLSPAE